MEEMFEIKIDPDLVIPENFQTIGSIIKLIESLK